MVNWNLPLKVGLAGLAAVVLCAAWFVVRAVLHQGVPRPWLLGLAILFLVSVLTTVGSQVTIVYKLSVGGGEGDDPPLE
jgi:uncharacterized membrane protein (UPF0182 family)